MFNLIRGDHLSLNEVLTFNQSGGSVIRGAHLGNQYLSNIFLSEKGVTVLLDENLSGENIFYKPAYIRVDNSLIRLSKNKAKSNKHLPQIEFTQHMKIPNSIINSIPYPVDSINRISQFHWIILNKQHRKFKLISSYLLNSMLAIEIINIIAEKMPYCFKLYVDVLGRPYRLSKVSDKTLLYTSMSGESIEIKKYHLFDMILNYLKNTEKSITELNWDVIPSGVIISTSLYIFLSSAIECYMSSNNSIMHIAGRKMMDYMFDGANNSYVMEINDIYNTIITAKSSLIPSEINFTLIPSVNLDSLITTNENICNFNNELRRKNRFIRSDDLHLGYTQYDLIAYNKKIFFPEGFMDISNKCLSGFFLNDQNHDSV